MVPTKKFAGLRVQYEIKPNLACLFESTFLIKIKANLLSMFSEGKNAAFVLAWKLYAS